MTDLERLAALSAAATKGSWESNHAHHVPPSVWIGLTRVAECYLSDHDAALIAAMRNSIDALVAECLAAREWLKADDQDRTRLCNVCDRGHEYGYCTCTDPPAVIAAREAYRKLVATSEARPGTGPGEGG